MFVVLLFGFQNYLHSQKFTINSGNWQTNSIWNNNQAPPVTIKNNYSHSKIIIGANHVVFLGTWSSNINLTIEKNGFILEICGKFDLYGNLYANNSLTINICETGIFNIYGNVDVNNMLKINVAPGGIFNVDGNINMHNLAELTIDGIMNANNVTGHNNNNIGGSGHIYADTIVGVNYNNFNGIIVGGNTNLSLPAPFNLTLTEYIHTEIVNPESTHQTSLAASSEPVEITTITTIYLYLKWEFDGYEPGGGYEFLGFQLFKDTTGAYHYDEIIAGKNEPYENKYYWDIYKSQKQAYYVRAVYMKNGKYVYSQVSNVVWYSNISGKNLLVGGNELYVEPYSRSINVYPNPNLGDFTINLEPLGYNNIIQIINISGQIVKFININNTGKQCISVEGLSSGAYIIRYLEDNAEVDTKKMLVK